LQPFCVLQAWCATVAQPPLPPHEFLLAQPLSPALQPPWLLQLFMPLQACLSAAAAAWPAAGVLPLGLVSLEQLVRVVAPSSRPATAAERSRDHLLQRLRLA
jgi:hypothetical protein